MFIVIIIFVGSYWWSDCLCGGLYWYWYVFFWWIGCVGDGEIICIFFLNVVFVSGGVGWLGVGGIVFGCVFGWGNCGV